MDSMLRHLNKVMRSTTGLRGDLFCPLHSADALHFFLGSRLTGAPFHLHADAMNILVQGGKTWYISPPQHALYSREPVDQWLREQWPGFRAVDPDRILVCDQAPGDMIYIPFDWSHATVNHPYPVSPMSATEDTNPAEDVTFGYALELFNRRELFVGRDKKDRTCPK